MDVRDSNDRGAISRRIRAEAAVWVALLHAPVRNAAAESAVQRWLAESPAHAAAFERATEVWNKTGNLRAGLPQRGGQDVFQQRSRELGRARRNR
jgi:ferric-dicitrate binding protein FerR (iron transport regulator)